MFVHYGSMSNLISHWAWDDFDYGVLEDRLQGDLMGIAERDGMWDCSVTDVHCNKDDGLWGGL